jgi:hypothetical protein
MPFAYEGGICTDEAPNSIAISEAQYVAALAGFEDGKTVSIVGGFHLIDPPQVSEPDPDENLTLDQWKLKLLTKIDADAEISRLRYITGGSGQAMTYQQKAQEAAAALQQEAEGGNPQPEDYPLLQAEMGITAPTFLGVAIVVNNAYQSWRVVGGQIEALRLGGKASVSASTSIEDAKQAAAIAWP